MRVRSIYIVTWVAVLLPLQAQAVSLFEETSYSSIQLNENINVDGDIGGSPDVDPSFNWNANYGYERSETPNPGGPAILDKTYNYSAGLGWAGNSEFSFNIKLNYSTTPAENLIDRGGQLSLGYRWLYRDSGGRDFSPYLGFRLIGSDSDYVATFNGSIPRKKQAPKPVSGTSELRQTMLGLDLTFKPLKTLKFDFETDHYTYNRDVVEFESQLDSPTALQRGMNGFMNTVGGVASLSYNGSISWDFVTNWNATISEQYSLLAADHSVSTMGKFTFNYQIAKSWDVTLGIERETSNVLSDTLAILGVECEF